MMMMMFWFCLIIKKLSFEEIYCIISSSLTSNRAGWYKNHQEHRECGLSIRKTKLNLKNTETDRHLKRTEFLSSPYFKRSVTRRRNHQRMMMMTSCARAATTIRRRSRGSSKRIIADN